MLCSGFPAAEIVLLLLRLACQRIVQEFNEEIEKEDGTAEIDVRGEKFLLDNPATRSHGSNRCELSCSSSLADWIVSRQQSGEANRKEEDPLQEEHTSYRECF